jgi:acetoin utilization deacetylase AcuC-like enzyme
MKRDKIITFYDERMVLSDDSEKNRSRSPLKPKRLMEFLGKEKLLQHFEIKSFEPFSKEDFLIAHMPDYVHNFFNGVKRKKPADDFAEMQEWTPSCESNCLEWSPQFAETVRYTNASLYEAIRHSILNPTEVGFSPTSGFHHATPWFGGGFCTFSGQVIASMKIYREFGLKGCYVDLDGHFGNSIEDSRAYVSGLNEAIPKDANINIVAWGEQFVETLGYKLDALHTKIVKGEIDYVVFCHGADSHQHDDFGGGCNTEQWLRCSEMFYAFVNEVEKEIERPLPVALSLFGGYRKDDYDSVLSLHTADLVCCLNTLSSISISYTPTVKLKQTN